VKRGINHKNHTKNTHFLADTGKKTYPCNKEITIQKPSTIHSNLPRPFPCNLKLADKFSPIMA
jgi:hypothetical protein